MSTCVIIPARSKSNRIPNKPLLKINNKEFLLLRTFTRIIKNFPKNDVYIATDSEKVKKAMLKFTKKIILIKKNCLNGSERCSLALRKIKKKYDYCIIASCDMPFLNGKILNFLVKKNKIKNKYDGLTVHSKILNKNVLKNKSIAKIILNNNQIVNFTRSNIKSNKKKIFTHNGLVLLKRKILLKYIKLKNTPLQLKEDNEWLKLIENGYKIYSYPSTFIKPEINTTVDLKKYFPLKFKYLNKLKKLEYVN